MPQDLQEAPRLGRPAAVGRLALVGHPNVGKSVIFQALTGRYAAVSNYPGTTVEITRGAGRFGGRDWLVADTPGVRGLTPRSEEEAAARDFLLDEPPDVLVQVGDMKELRRVLQLTLELAPLGRPMVLVLNLADEARARGIGVDAARLSRSLGFPVIPAVAVTGEGLAEVRRAIAEARPYAGPRGETPDVSRALESLEGALPPGCPSPRAVAEMVLGGDPTMAAYLSRRYDGSGASARPDRAAFAVPPELLMFTWRKSVADELAAGSSWKKGGTAPAWLERLGMALLRPLPGALAAAAVLLGLYEFVGVFAARIVVDFLENRVFGAWLLPPVAAGLGRLLPKGWLLDLWVGPSGLISMGLTYSFAIILPVVTAFFLFFSLLEDSGYLPRLSVLLDRVFRKVGLNGKAVFPMILGLGCGTMATLTTRVLDTPRDRLLVTLLLALAIPCSAQLGVVLGLLAGLSAAAAAVWLGAVVLSFFGVGWAASRLLPGSRSPFWIEIPPLRVPLLVNILRKVRTRVFWYLREAVPLFIAGTLVLFVLDKTGGLRVLERVLAPVVTGWLGLPREATFSLVAGFLKRDYGAAGFFDLAKRGLLSPVQIVVSLVTLTLFLPCFAQFLVMIKERGLKAAVLVAAAVTSLALAAGGAVRLLLAAAGGLP